MTSTAKWTFVADQLRRQIEREELPPGSQITPEAELAEELGVGRATVRRAVQALTEEGLLTAGRGLGRRVRERPTLLSWDLSAYEDSKRSDTHSTDAWNQGIEAQGMTPLQEVTVLKEYAQGEIATWLGLSGDDLVTVRRRIRYANNQPYQLSTSYFPQWLAAGSALELPGDQSAPGGLLASVGYPQRALSDHIRGRMPSRNESEALHIASGIPVIEHVRIGYAIDETPVRVMITVVPTDRWELRYDLAVTQEES